VKDLSSEQRTLLAFFLSMIVLMVWGYFYKPAPPPRPLQTTPAQTTAAPAAPAKGLSAAPAAPVVPPTAAAQEKTIVVENDLYRVEFSSRGAVVRSWQLKKYTDDAKPPHTLDLVHPPSGNQPGEWPLALVLQDAQQEVQANSALYEVTPAQANLRAPAELGFSWSDGHLAVTKRLKFSHGYIVELDSSVSFDGRPMPLAVAWRGGFGDATAYKAAEQVSVFFSAGGKLEVLPYKKLGTAARPEEPLHEAAAAEYGGIEDHFFAAAFLPRVGTLDVWHWRTDRDVVEDAKAVKEPVAEVAAGTIASAPLAVRIYIGPKDFNDLGKLQPPLQDLVQFGWFGFIAKPLFFILKWIYIYVPNYGWAIVVLTLAINFALFPLKVKSWRSMQKMQRVMPEVKTIQNRYSKYSMRDPRKQQMNAEVMEVYRREGINPLGGCLPMLLQMPIWFALYRMLGATIELRHAPWFGWIHDLSGNDPYYALPILMGVTMFIAQKMTPMTTTDPAQQRMMNLMPIGFAGMFIVFPVSSGLVLYILTQNIVSMGQQWYLNRTAPASVAVPAARKKKK
jgi:YidC/Oxa1 family membrane protein insertase